MSQSQIEKELKFKTSDPQKILSLLLDLGAKIVNKNKQKTTRFDTPDHKLDKRGVFIRVRSEGDKNTITLKEKIGEDKTVKQRKETEFKIEDLNRMSYIIQKLGFNYARIMEKYRIELSYRDSLICIDEMPFGFYIEIEGDEPEINNIAQELGFNKDQKIIVTYWQLFEQWKKETSQQGDDIVFPEKHKSQLL